MKSVSLKIHGSASKRFLTCVDIDLLGKSFTEGKICLRITETFYGGDEISLDEAAVIIREGISSFDSVHLIGEGIITHLDTKGIICKDDARRVKNVPHMMIISC